MKQHILVGVFACLFMALGFVFAVLSGITRSLYPKDPPNDAGPLSTFRTTTLEDLVAHNMVMVPADQYEIEKEMVRRFKEQARSERSTDNVPASI